MNTLKIINMPFADIDYASFSLAQIKTYLKKHAASSLSSEVLYINHEFAQYIGADIYRNFDFHLRGEKMGIEVEHNTHSLMDWFFKAEAFPDEPDNLYEYFQAYSPDPKFENYIYQKRSGLRTFLIKMIHKYNLLHSNFIGFTSMFAQSLSIFAFARLIKNFNPNIPIILGGPNCLYPNAEIILKHNSYIDYVLSGYSLHSFWQLIKCLSTGNSDGLNDIPGLYRRDNSLNASIIHPQCIVSEPDDINGLLDVDYDDFFCSLKRQSYPTKPILFFETSRGCWWNEKGGCLFCGVNGQNSKYRAMNYTAAIKYMENLMRYATQCNLFWATDSVIPIDYLDNVFANISIPSNIKIFYEIRAEMSLSNIEKLKKNHIELVQVGIESLYTPTLNLMHKGVTAIQNIAILKGCDQNGIGVLWNLLVGFPYEDYNAYRIYLKLFPYLFHLPPPSGLWAVSYQRTSPYVNNQEHYNLKLKPIVELYRKIYPYTENEMKQMTYYFENTKINEFMTIPNLRLIYRVNQIINLWKDSWCNKDFFPKLYYMKREECPAIYDNRLGTETITILNRIEYDILTYLSERKKIDQITEDLPVENLHSILGFLEGKHWIFRDNDEYISLVYEKKPEYHFPFIPELIEKLY